MLDTAPRRTSARSSWPQAHRDTGNTGSNSLFAAVIGVFCLVLALTWVMNLESTLPSIRIGTANASSATILEPGDHLAEDKGISLSGNWFKQSLGTANPAVTSTSMVTTTSGSSMSFRFYGTDLSMIARIGPESGEVYVSVDGQPSPILPVDNRGSYVDLSGTQAEDQSIQIASGLAHKDHTVVISSVGTSQVAISGFVVNANTPFPWAFVVLYVALTAALFVLVRYTVIAVSRRMGWIG